MEKIMMCKQIYKVETYIQVVKNVQDVGIKRKA